MKVRTLAPSGRTQAAAKTERFSAWSRLLSPPRPEERRTAWQARAGGVLAILALAGYLAWRAAFTMPTGGFPLVAGWILWSIEAVPIVPLAFRLVMLWRLDAAPPPRSGAQETFGPVVLFIPTYNEPPAVLAPTVAAACRLRPAHETWVLDDGDRPWVREMCDAYGARYVQREVHDHAKAGNINHALAVLDREAHPAEFIAILDCDHVPLDGFLHETLGWFDDPRIALVQAPQAYFNESAFDADGFAGEQGIFFHALMISRSGPRSDPPWCGSTSVVRRSALAEVGGVATETITEDLHTTLKLVRRGWRTVYHHQILAVGLAPHTPEQYLIQRRRWALGAMQVYVQEKLWRPKRWLTARNQLEYLVAAFWWFEGAFTAAAMLAPAAVLIAGVQPVRTDPLLYAALISAEVLVRMFGANLLYRGYIRWRHALELRVLRIPVGLESLWWLITRRRLEFQVTPKGASEDRLEGRVPPILVTLSLLLGVVLVYGALTLFVPLPWHSSKPATMVGGVWLLWGEVMLLMSMARIRDPGYRTTRRVAHRFNVGATVEVDGVRGSLLDISTTGLAVALERPPAGETPVRLPGGSAITMHLVRGGEGRAAYEVAPGDFAGIRALTDWIYFTPPDPGHDVPAGLPAAAVIGDDFEKPPAPPAHGRRNDIQGLRAIAVGLVFASHLGLSAFGGGFLGVDVFFVISGFLITGLMVREFRIDGRISLRDFYARRAQRILPAAIVVSAAILVATGMTQTSIRVWEYAHDALWSTAFLQNLHLIHQATDYFADATASPFQHFWSLSIEEQFYAVWPLLLILLLRSVRTGSVLLVVGALAALSLGASISLTRSQPEAAYFSTYTRAFELGLGALLALGVLIAPQVPRWFAWVGGAVGLAVIALCAVRMSSTGYPGWHALIPTLATVLVLAAGLRHQVGVNWVLGLPPFRWLGNISYSLYLWHFPVIQLGGPLIPSTWSTPARDGLLVAVSLVCADLTYRLVESPLLRIRKTTFRELRPLAWWPVAAVTALGVAFASSGYATHREHLAQQNASAWYASHASLCAFAPSPSSSTPPLGAIEAELACGHTFATAGAPIPPDVSAPRIAADSFKSMPGLCWSKDGYEIAPCPGTIRKGRPTMVLLGDSHMGQWLPALQRVAAAQGYNFAPFVRVGCPVWQLATVPGGENGYSPACAAYRSSSRKAIAALHPALVLVSSITDVGVGDGGSPNARDWRNGVASVLPKLRALAPKVVLLSDTPLRETMAVPDPSTCVGTAGYGLADCELDLPADFVRADDWVKQTAASAGVGDVDVQPLVCDDQYCPAIADGIGVFSDDSHVSLTWSRHVSRALGQLLQQAGVLPKGY